MNNLEEKMREMLRGLGDVAADPAYRERMKHSFVHGDILRERRSDSHRGDGHVQERWGSRRVGWIALAASLALFVWLANAYTGPRWILHRTAGEGQVLVDGRPPSLTEEGLARTLRAGTLLSTTGEAQADLLCGNLAVLRVPPGAELTVPTSPGRWFRRSFTCDLQTGEIRLATTSHFAGARLSIRTALASVEVTGTTLAVFAGPDSTCLCVLEGSAAMIDRTGGMSRVGAGDRFTLFRDVRAPRRETIFPMERMKLEMMRADVDTILRR